MHRTVRLALVALCASAAVGCRSSRVQQATARVAAPQAETAAGPQAETVAAPAAETVMASEPAPVIEASAREESAASDVTARGATHRVVVDLSDPKVRAWIDRRIEEQKREAERRHAAAKAAEISIENGTAPPE